MAAGHRDNPRETAVGPGTRSAAGSPRHCKQRHQATPGYLAAKNLSLCPLRTPGAVHYSSGPLRAQQEVGAVSSEMPGHLALGTSGSRATCPRPEDTLGSQDGAPLLLTHGRPRPARIRIRTRITWTGSRASWRHPASEATLFSLLSFKHLEALPSLPG